MRPEFFELGWVYPVSTGDGFRFVQHVGVLGARAVVVVLDVVRDDLPFPEELDDVGPLLLPGPSLLYFVMDGALDAARALCELPIRWAEPGKRAPTIVRFEELSARIARELAVLLPEQEEPSAPTSPSLIDDDGVLVIACGASFVGASDTFAYPDALLAARARGQLVFFECGDAGTLRVVEVEKATAHRFVGVLAGKGPWWVMPLSQFTQGGAPANAVALSPATGPRAVYASREGATVQIVRTNDTGTPPLAATEVPSL